MSPVTTRASLGFHSSGCDPAGVQSLPLLIPWKKILAGLRSRKFTQGKNNEKWQSVTAGSIGVVVRYRGDCGRCANLDVQVHHGQGAGSVKYVRRGN
jgi:hypothetical protein